MNRNTSGLVPGLLLWGLAGMLAYGCGGSHSSGGGGFAPPTSNTNTNNLNVTNNGGNTDPHVASALGQINASRATQNLPALQLDTSLSACALRHAEDCAHCANFIPQNFANCAHGDFKSGDTCGANAENQGVASGVSEDAGFTELHQAMMAEGPPPPGQDNHYANIMNASSSTVGIGLYIDPNGTLWLSEEFR